MTARKLGLAALCSAFALAALAYEARTIEARRYYGWEVLFPLNIIVDPGDSTLGDISGSMSDFNESSEIYMSSGSYYTPGATNISFYEGNYTRSVAGAGLAIAWSRDNNGEWVRVGIHLALLATRCSGRSVSAAHKASEGNRLVL